MIEAARSQISCPSCGQPFDLLRARSVAVIATKVISFCSDRCRDTGVSGPIEIPTVVRRSRRPLAIALVLTILGAIFGVRISFDNRLATAALPAPPPPVITPVVEPHYGPNPPPADFFVEGDRWVHPLLGPARRLPIRPSRRFGVDRPHDSPESCREGHCGVDIGEVKGEAVLAVHDGVVDRVIRDEEHLKGGKYVRLLHKSGTIVSQYMHLDYVHPDLRSGVHVRAGEPIGTVGDSGIENSGPHLHFTVSTRSTEGHENYLDPEPLLTLWPLLTR